MSILLLVVVLLVIAIVLSRLTWASQLGERRSIKHHEQAMDVLRSVAGRPEDAEEARVHSAHGAYSAHGTAHVRSSVDEDSGFPEPAARNAVPETSLRREETIRILRTGASEEDRAEPSSAGPSRVGRPSSAPSRVDPAEPRPGAPWEPAASAAPTGPAPTAPARPTAPQGEELVGSEAAAEPTGVEARHGGGSPSWEPAHGPHGRPNGDGEPVKPAFVFLDDDNGRPGPVTVPPDVADAVRRSDGGRWPNGGRGDDDRAGRGAGWGNGHRWEDDPAAVSSTLPRPPSIDDQDWGTSSRSEARSRSRARTRSRLLGSVLAPFAATGRAASGARDRLGAHRAAAGGGSAADTAPDTRVMASVAEAPPTEGVTVVPDESAHVARAPTREADVTTGDGDGGTPVATAPVPEVPSMPPGADGGGPVSQGIGATALDAGRATAQRAAEASRQPRVRLAAGLVAIVVLACVVVAVLLATMSSSSKNASNTVQPAGQAPPPARTAPAPPPSTLTLVSRDDQGAWFNVNSSRLTVSAAATGRVWLQVVAGTNAFGPVLFQGILTDGQTQTITNDAPVWMRIGASSNVNVKVNGAGVLLPQVPNTFNLAFTHG